MKESKEIRVRIAPSPTGDPHVGTAYIALFNYVFAKKNNGKFLIRIEDTDRERSNLKSEELILKYLKWLGLNWDEGPDIGGPYAPYRQSERKEIYLKYAEELLNNGFAYRCFCSEERLEKLREFQRINNLPPGYDGKCRDLDEEKIEENLENKIDFVIRLRMPKFGNTIVKDEIRGEIVFENIKSDDQILVKSDGYPTYHLANVVDDKLMGITHVIRAEEWIPSTPKHIILYNSFGWELPKWIHMPLLRNNDRSKISKRKNATSLEFYYNEGYLKEGLLNFLALMGWHIGDNKEIFSIEEMIKHFTFEKISLGGPVFDISKLNWLNRHYIRNCDENKLFELALPFYQTYFKVDDDKEFMKRIINEEKNNAHTLKELVKNSEIYLKSAKEVFNTLNDDDKVKALNILKDENVKKVIALFKGKIEKVELNYENTKNLLQEIKDELSLPSSKVLPLIRVIVTGELKGTELPKFISILGKERTLDHINSMLELTSLELIR